MKSKLSLLLFIFLVIIGQVFAIEEEYEGELEDDKEEDSYEISLDEGDAVLITAEAARGSELDTILILSDSGGRTIEENDDYEYPDSTNSRIIFIAEEDDNYTITVAAYSGSSGEYVLTIEYISAEEAEELIEEANAPDEDEVDTTPARDPDLEFEGTIRDDDDTEEYALDLDAGQGIVVAMYSTNGELDTYLTVVDPNGVEILINDDRADYSTYDSQVAFIAQEDGEYTIIASNYPGSSGDYRLEIYFATDEEVAFAEQALRVLINGPIETLATEHFLIHYTTEGEDAIEEDFLEEIAETVEEVYDIQINELGWAVPPSDLGQGGDGRIDVYIENITDAYGYASSSSAAGDNPNTDFVEESASAAYLVLDNDYTDYDDSRQAMRATVAHEFHHVVQYGYDDDDYQWYFEASASWMETVTFPEDEEATIYVDDVFKYPELCFGGQGDADESGYGVYGTWLFLEFMFADLDEDAPFLLWENVARYEEWQPLEETLAEYDTTMPEFLARYHINNLVRDYQFVDSFDSSTVWLELEIDDEGDDWTFSGEGIQELSANYFEFAVDEGIYEISLGETSDDLQLFVIAIHGDTGYVFELGDGDIFENDGYDDVYVMVFNADYDDSMDSCRYEDYLIVVEEAGRGNPVDASYEVDASNFRRLR